MNVTLEQYEAMFSALKRTRAVTNLITDIAGNTDASETQPEDVQWLCWTLSDIADDALKTLSMEEQS